MDYKLLLQLKDRANKIKTELPPEVAASFNDSFNVEYAHNSTAIEGNTLTLIQTKAVIEDGLSVGGKTLREIYEVANHAKAFAYVQKCVTDKKPLDENTVKDIHALLMDNIIIGGVYRNVEVFQVRGINRRHQVKCTVRLKTFFQTLRINMKITP